MSDCFFHAQMHVTTIPNILFPSFSHHVPSCCVHFSTMHCTVVATGTFGTHKIQVSQLHISKCHTCCTPPSSPNSVVDGPQPIVNASSYLAPTPAHIVMWNACCNPPRLWYCMFSQLLCVQQMLSKLSLFSRS